LTSEEKPELPIGDYIAKNFGVLTCLRPLPFLESQPSGSLNQSGAAGVQAPFQPFAAWLDALPTMSDPKVTLWEVENLEDDFPLQFFKLLRSMPKITRQLGVRI